MWAEVQRKNETIGIKDKQIKTLRQTVRRLRIKIDKIDKMQIEKNLKDQDDYIRVKKSVTDDAILALLRRMTGQDKGEYTDPHLRTFAISQHFYSPAGYRYLRKQFNNALPDESTLRGWFASVDGNPGFTQESFNALKALSEEQGRQLPVCLMIDDMNIRKKNVKSNENNVSGDVNLGPNSGEIAKLKKFKTKKGERAPSPDTPRPATEVCVFMIVCLDLRLKIPVGYFLHDRLNGEQLELLARRCMQDLYNVGIVVRAITADGAGCNRNMAARLGADIRVVAITRHRTLPTVFNPREPKPYFPHPSDSSIRVHYIMDVCHMLKLVRNSLAGRKVLKDSDGNTISWHDITALHRKQAIEGLRLGNKLTERHKHWYQNKQKVTLAAQTLSRSVAMSLLFCEMYLPTFKGASATAKFLLMFNDLFDVLNSFTTYSYGCKAAMSLKNEVTWSAALERAKHYIYGLQIRDPKRQSYHSVLDSERVVGFQGFLVAIESVKGLFDDLVRNGPMKYLCTYKLSQDHLEAFFGKTRQRFGPDNNPHAVSFMGSYKRLLIGSEIAASRSANILPQECIKILNFKETSKAARAAKSKKERHKEEERKKLISEIVSLGLFANPDPRVSHLNVFVKAIVGYTAGYVAKAVHRKSNCELCKSTLKATNLNTANLGDYGGLISFKTVNHGLTVPQKDVVFVCSLVEEKIRNLSPSNEAPKLQLVAASREDSIRQITIDSMAAGAFSSLQYGVHTNGTPTEHRQQLIYSICDTYYKIRARRLFCVFNDLNISNAIRHKYTKLILFSNQ